MATKEFKVARLPNRLSSSGDTGYSMSPGAFSLPRSMKEVGDYLSSLALEVEELQNERDKLLAQIQQFKDQYPHLLKVTESDADEGLKLLEDDSEENESVPVRSHSEQPESGRFISNELHRMSDYIKRQESEKTVFAYGQYFQMCGKTETSDGNLRSPEKCTESLSENEQLKQQLEEARASIDKLSWQLAEARIKYPDAKLSSGETSESLSRVEEPALIRSQSMPAQLLTAHRKIDLLQKIYDNLLAEKKETESALESSLKTVQSLDDSLEAERFEKFKAMGDVKHLKSELEGLKERVSKKPSQNTETYMHTHSPHLQEEASLMCELKTLREQLAHETEKSEKAIAEARQRRRDMKEQLDRTVGEKILLEDQVEKLTTEKADANRKRREMKEALDRTVAEKLLLEDEVKEQKRLAKHWKMQLDETTGRCYQKQDEIAILQQQLRGRGK